MWGAAHREVAVAKDIFAQAFKKYPCDDRATQLLVESAASASPAALSRIHSLLAKKDSSEPFIRAARDYTQWLAGQGHDNTASKITADLERHSWNKRAFGRWIRKELTFEIWSRGVED